MGKKIKNVEEVRLELSPREQSKQKTTAKPKTQTTKVTTEPKSSLDMIRPNVVTKLSANHLPALTEEGFIGLDLFI